MTDPVSTLVEKLMKDHKALHMTFCVVGIVSCLMVYGFLQERIMSETWHMPGAPEGDEGEMFKYSVFLVLCNRIMTCSVAIIILLTKGESMAPVAPVQSYAAVSVSNVVATTCQYEALRHISFPVQTLAKCAKMIPVMIWGTFIMAKKYNIKDYIIAITVTMGTTVFFLTGEIKSKHAANTDSSFYGMMLMVGYLFFDGFTSTTQDKLFKGYQMNIFNQVLYVTGCSSFFSFLGLVTSKTLGGALAFVAKYPQCMTNIAGLSLASTIGQLFIMHTIKSYGALLFATVMTTRQFLSILLSSFYYQHPLTSGQWLGTVIVFGALYYKTASKKNDKKKPTADAGIVIKDQVPLISTKNGNIV